MRWRWRSRTAAGSTTSSATGSRCAATTTRACSTTPASSRWRGRPTRPWRRWSGRVTASRSRSSGTRRWSPTPVCSVGWSRPPGGPVRRRRTSPVRGVRPRLECARRVARARGPAASPTRGGRMTGTTGRPAGRAPGGHRFTARDLALVAVFAGVMAALGLVPAWTPPGFTVPITAQSMGVMLAGGVLGGRRGALSMLVFLALVAIGLPLLAGGRGGLGVFAGPSVGFLDRLPRRGVRRGGAVGAHARHRLGHGSPGGGPGGQRGGRRARALRLRRPRHGGQPAHPDRRGDHPAVGLRPRRPGQGRASPRSSSEPSTPATRVCSTGRRDGSSPPLSEP